MYKSLHMCQSQEKLAIEKDELNKNYRTTKKIHTNHQNGSNSNSTTLKNMFFNNLSVSKLYITTGKLHGLHDMQSFGLMQW